MKVRKVTYPSGRVKWCADLGIIEGRRQQSFFDSADEATAAVEKARGEKREHGTTALAMTHQTRLRYAEAEVKLAAVGATIDDAVRYYLAHCAKISKPVRVADLVTACQEEKRRLGRRPQYVRMLPVAGLALDDWLPPGTMAHEVTSDMVRSFIRSRTQAPKTAINWLADLHTIWAFALANGHASIDPTQGVERPSKDDGEIDFLRVDEVKRALQLTETAEPMLLAYHVLGIFAGVRPNELERMTWEDINLGDASAVVRGKTAKTRQRRIVELEPVAIAWLKQCKRRDDGKLTGARIERRLAALRVDFKLGREWPHDVMRHTYASMHYAQWRDEKRLQANMGHRSSAMLYTNYRGLVQKSEAEKFWKLTPSAVRA